MKTLTSFIRCQSGATAIEYGLIASLIVVAIIGGITAVGSANEAMYQDIETHIRPKLAP